MRFNQIATRSFEESVNIDPPPLFASTTTLYSFLPIPLPSSNSLAAFASNTADSFPSCLARVPDSCYFSSIKRVSYRDALGSADRALWEAAIAEELAAMKKHSVWVVEDLPPGCKALPTCWVLIYKFDSSGTITWYKARLVARGDKQVASIDYKERYAPVVNWATIRTVCICHSTGYGYSPVRCIDCLSRSSS